MHRRLNLEEVLDNVFQAACITVGLVRYPEARLLVLPSTSSRVIGAIFERDIVWRI